MTPALAQPAPAPESVDTVTIRESAFAGTQGRVGINTAAGELNQQINAVIIAEGETALLTGRVVQVLEFNTVSGAQTQTATIADEAFAGAQGAIAVNGAAGAENQQANVAGIIIGFEGQVASTILLLQSRASVKPAEAPGAATDTKYADISPEAFAQAGGLVQVNLTAGERNTSANLFTLNVPGGIGGMGE